MSELVSSGGLLGYAALLWSELPDTAVGRIAAASSGPAAGVPDERAEPGAPVPAPRAAGRRRIGS